MLRQARISIKPSQSVWNYTLKKNREKNHNLELCEWSCSVCAKSLQLCPTLCDPPGTSVHGILQARKLECVAFSYSSDQTTYFPLLPWQAGSLPLVSPGKPHEQSLWSPSFVSGKRLLWLQAWLPLGRIYAEFPQTFWWWALFLHILKW